MPDVEKVINGLECCDNDDCDNCPYFRSDDENDLGTCKATLHRDALVLLKAQEPRVMDFDDVVGGDECYLEAINGARGYADCYACTGTGEVQVFRCNFDNPQYIKASDYMKTWRCWTSRPTDEQRRAVPWN